MPILGLVCLTSDKSISFRTVHMSRLLRLKPVEQYKVLYDIYVDNINMLKTAIKICIDNNIKMYRISSDMLPFFDTYVGRQVLKEHTITLSNIGALIQQNNIRITCHPGQFITLTVDNEQKLRNSIDNLQAHAQVFDYLGLPENYWHPIIIHGGKKDNLSRLIDNIKRLPTMVHNRLVLENDEYSYGIETLISMQELNKIPIVFDAHHHLVNQKLEDYNHPSIPLYLEAAKATWPAPEMQLVHISNGKDSLHDRSHSDYITQIPDCFLSVPYIEVEAKAKEQAIFALRNTYPGVLE